MIYKFDEAIVNDLKRTIDPEGGANPNVVCITIDNYQSTLAQMQEDKITYPIILLIRDDITYYFDALLHSTESPY